MNNWSPIFRFWRMVTKKQVEYLSLFEAGYSVTEIAAMKGVNKSTVSRVLTKARTTKCPFSKSCLTCPLNECAMADTVAFMFNGNDRKRNQHYKQKREVT